MRTELFLLAVLLPLAGCQSDAPSTAGAAAACPADVSEADRYKYPACK